MMQLFLIICVLYIMNSLGMKLSNPQVQVKSQLESLIRPIALTSLLTLSTSINSNVNAASFEYQPALQGLDYGKPRTIYPDFKQIEKSGLQYKPVKEGDGATPKVGDRVVVDWEGYTIGYYGRPFQTRNTVVHSLHAGMRVQY